VIGSALPSAAALVSGGAPGLRSSLMLGQSASDSHVSVDQSGRSITWTKGDRRRRPRRCAPCAPCGPRGGRSICSVPRRRWSSSSPDGRRCRAPCPMSWTACSAAATSRLALDAEFFDRISHTWWRGSTRRCRRTVTSATTRPIDRSGPTAGSTTSASSPRACRATSPPPPTSRGRSAKRGSGPLRRCGGPGHRQPEGAGSAVRRDGGPGGRGPRRWRTDAGGAHEVVGRPAIWSPGPSLGQPSSAHVRLRRPSFGAPSAVPS